MLAQFADGRRIQAASLVAFGVVFPLAFVFSAAAVVLTALRRSVLDGMLVAGLGIAFVGVLLGLAGGGLGSLAGFAAALLLCIAMADVLRRFSSLALTLQAGLALSLVMLAVILLGLEDPAAYWRGMVVQALDQMAAQGSPISDAQRELWMTAVPFNAMSGIVVGMILLMCWGGLFLGRSWQARLVNPGGFRKEFHQLKLGKALAFGSAVVFFADTMVSIHALLNVAAVLIHVWIVQGLSYFHWMVGVSGAGMGWLVLVYGLLIFFWLTGNPLAVTVPVIGIVGEMIDFRRVAGRFLARNKDDKK